MSHPEIELLSSYVDDEVDAPLRAELEGHLGECGLCHGRVFKMQEMASSLRSMPMVTPLPEELAKIRQAAAAAVTQGKNRSIWLKAGWLVGAASIIIIAFVAIGQILPKDSATQSPANQNRAELAAEETYDSPEQVRMALQDDDTVKARIGNYTVEDVGRLQPDMLLAYDDHRSYGLAAKSAQDSGDEAPSMAESTASSSIGQCMREVLKTQNYPMLPLLGRSVVFKNEPAWLLAFAFTNEKESSAKLDLVQVWVVNRSTCIPIQYTYFKP